MNIWHTGPKKCLSLPNQLITIITKKQHYRGHYHRTEKHLRRIMHTHRSTNIILVEREGTARPALVCIRV